MESIEETFARQHGVLARRQALQAGMTDRQIGWQLRRRRWERPYRGVYRLAGSPRSPQQDLFAAWLATGPGAVVSHGSAAFHWGMLPPPRRPAVTVPRANNPRPGGFDVHRSGDLDWSRVRMWHGLPCTDPLRTMVDLARLLGPQDLDEAVDRALATKLVTVDGLVAELGRLSKRGRRGVGHLRRALARRGLIGGPNPSVLESRGSAFLRRYRIPVLAAEERAGPDGQFRVDFVLVPGVIFELDGYAWHSSPEHKRHDEARRRLLSLEGNQVLVATWLDLRRDPAGLARDLRCATR